MKNVLAPSAYQIMLEVSGIFAISLMQIPGNKCWGSNIFSFFFNVQSCSLTIKLLVPNFYVQYLQNHGNGAKKLLSYRHDCIPNRCNKNQIPYTVEPRKDENFY